jgi:hypothetical protein
MLAIFCLSYIVSPEDLSREAWLVVGLLSLPVTVMLIMLIGGIYHGGNQFQAVLVAVGVCLLALLGVFACCYSLYSLSVLPSSPGLELPKPPPWPP